jgi:putative FmdB family regulatory protein
MPYYDYECNDCNNPFDIYRSIKVAAGNVVCPKCGSLDTRQVYKKAPMTSVQGLPKDRFK